MRVLDVHDPEFWNPVLANPDSHRALMEWCVSHGVVPGWTWRLEILVVDGPVLRSYSWLRDENGKHVLQHGPDGPELVEEIRDRLLRSDPPVTFRDEE